MNPPTRPVPLRPMPPRSPREARAGISLKTALSLALGALVLGGLIAYAVFHNPSPDAAQEPYLVPPMAERYTNVEHRFSVTMPEGFGAREVSDGVSDTIVFENDKAEGIQIVVTPFDDIKVLTKEMIQADIPDMAVTEEQPVEVGVNHIGLAFKSDNASFDGASREVWFVFKSKLFQISTYERFDPLLIAMFGTWQFDATVTPAE